MNRYILIERKTGSKESTIRVGMLLVYSKKEHSVRYSGPALPSAHFEMNDYTLLSNIVIYNQLQLFQNKKAARNPSVKTRSVARSRFALFVTLQSPCTRPFSWCHTQIVAPSRHCNPSVCQSRVHYSQIYISDLVVFETHSHFNSVSSISLFFQKQYIWFVFSSIQWPFIMPDFFSLPPGESPLPVYAVDSLLLPSLA